MHSYAPERIKRVLYVEQSRQNLINALQDNGDTVRRTLGATTLGLMLRHAGLLYVPKVDNDGIVSAQLASEGVPVIALTGDERIKRDNSFATFSPQQHRMTDRHGHLKHASRRLQQNQAPEETWFTDNDPGTAQNFGADSATIRRTYAVPGHPAHGTTYFNLRPLVVLNYNSEQNGAPANVLASALAQADSIECTPIMTFEGVKDATEAAFDAANRQIAEEAQQIASLL